jgi:hypothetical protein
MESIVTETTMFEIFGTIILLIFERLFGRSFGWLPKNGVVVGVAGRMVWGALGFGALIAIMLSIIAIDRHWPKF